MIRHFVNKQKRTVGDAGPYEHIEKLLFIRSNIPLSKAKSKQITSYTVGTGVLDGPLSLLDFIYLVWIFLSYL